MPVSGPFRLDIGGLCGNDPTTTISNQNLTVSTYEVGFTFPAPTADPITHVNVYCSTALSPPVHKCVISPVNASGQPDRTSDLATGTFTPAAGNNRVAVSYTPSNIGQLLSLRVLYDSGTLGGSNFAAFGYTSEQLVNIDGFPVAWYYTGSWTKSTSAGALFGIETANRHYFNPLAAAYSSGSSATSDGHRRAARFKLPSWMASCKVVGVEWKEPPSPATGGSIVMGMWDGTTVMESISFDTDIFSGSTNRAELYFDSEIELVADTEYRVGFERSGTSFALPYMTTPSNAANSAYEGGIESYYSEFSTSWSNTNTRMAFARLILSEFTLASSGGGGGGGRSSAMLVS